MRKLESEEAAVQTAIEKAKLPGYVVDVKLEFDADATGDPAVWLYVIVSDKEAKSRHFAEHALGIVDRLREAVRETGTERWPYIRFRSASEHAELASGEFD